MEEEATEAQIRFAYTLGIPEPASFSKQSLRELIDNSLKLKEAKKNGNGDVKKVEAEVVQPFKTQPAGSKREFHLSPEQVRTNALDMAIRCFKGNEADIVNILTLTKQFEEYLWNGS